MNRRQMLQSLSCGFGYLALRNLAAATATRPMAPKEPMFPARAKRVIFMYMQGAPSQFETFDYNPGLADAAKSKNGKFDIVRHFVEHDILDVADLLTLGVVDGLALYFRRENCTRVSARCRHCFLHR
jgi:hypothetical protein